MGVGGERHAPGSFTLWKETRYPLYRRLGGPQGRSGRVRKISSPLGFDPRTVRPVASRYTDWAIPDHKITAVRNLKLDSPGWRMCLHMWCNGRRTVRAGFQGASQGSPAGFPSHSFDSPPARDPVDKETKFIAPDIQFRLGSGEECSFGIDRNPLQTGRQAIYV